MHLKKGRWHNYHYLSTYFITFEKLLCKKLFSTASIFFDTKLSGYSQQIFFLLWSLLKSKFKKSVTQCPMPRSNKTALRTSLAMTDICWKQSFMRVFFWPRVFSFLLKMTFKVIFYDFLGTYGEIPEYLFRMFQRIFGGLLTNFVKQCPFICLLLTLWKTHFRKFK